MKTVNDADVIYAKNLSRTFYSTIYLQVAISLYC